MHIAFDADDTLWHNEPIFNLTQSKVEALLRAHVPDAELGARITDMERANLRLYGYGVKGYTLSLIETALTISRNELPAVVIRQILDAGKAMLEHPIELLPHVADTLAQLRGRHPLMLVTKGDLFDQESKLARSGLGDNFEIVEVVSEKNPETYRDLLARHGIAPERFVMIGNSVKSDMLPVVAIGGNAVHIPYESHWALDKVDHRGAEAEGFHEIADMSQLPAMLQKIAELGWE